MSSLTINAHGAAAPASAVFRSHHRGGHDALSDLESVPSVGRPGELPTGAGAALLNGAAQALQKTVSGSAAVGPSSAINNPGPIGSRINAHA